MRTHRLSGPSPSRAANMRAIRSRDTGPELALRRELFSRGLRYRIHYRPVTGLNRRADIAFVKARVAVLVHGCFWHGCPEHYTEPVTNSAFWLTKVAMNKERDHETMVLWKSAGWKTMVVWEHESASKAAESIEFVVRSAT